jgi:Ca2+/Na+ antiporter
VVGSVFGIFVFSFWQFFLYYAELTRWPELIKQIAFLATGVAAVILSILLTKIKHELVVAIICFVLFVIVMVVSYSANAPIKNAIAFQTDYFKHKVSEPKGFEPNETTTVFKHPAGGYKLSIPENWKLRTDKGPLFPYFQFMDGNAVRIELRPTCFAKEKAVITDIVSGIRDRRRISNKQSDVQCFQDKNSFHFCKIYQYSAGREIKRLNLIGVRDDISKGIDLDFVFFQDNPDVSHDVNGIIQSLAPIPETETNGNSVCLGLAEWF